MIVVGLTGGIGSGKSTVAKFFNEFGIPTYESDKEAKALMNRSKVIRRKLIDLFGKRAYGRDGLNRTFIAGKIFGDKTLLDKMNAIVHPKVRSHFKRWLGKQVSAYVIKEAAILFESGADVDCDYIITVTSSKADRIKRVMERDNSSKERVQSIMDNQWTDDMRIARSDFIIQNSDLEKTREQVQLLHQEILSKTQ
ncbi:MAG: dephospho-CoA kinase [Flavobacteriaceae bacterium]|nr:dephospho-CoA kinase [Bacteroidia bacterium]NNF74772.1 dephospho-CoA kinase [Flavobacteriaceae bacterium]NNK72499.1 dephospho-CoA kinase [Flavobacteriaceae bacterium]